MKLLGALIASAAALGGLIGGDRSALPPAYLFVEDYDKEGREIFSTFHVSNSSSSFDFL